MHETSAIVDDDGHEKRTFFLFENNFFTCRNGMNKNHSFTTTCTMLVSIVRFLNAIIHP